MKTQSRKLVLMPKQRRGAVLVLFVAVLVMTMIFAAFTVDVGYINLTKAELQKSADASALSAAIELKEGFGPGASTSQAQAGTNARAAAVAVAAANRVAGSSSITADPNSDVRLGTVVWDSNTNSWSKTWGTQPYNMVEVTLSRSGSASGANDGPLSLFFGPVIGKNNQNVHAKATVAMLPAIGFQATPGQPGIPEILPIALDEFSWNLMLAGWGSDNYHWDEATKTITPGSDGIREINIYPTGDITTPPGNRGTVDFGSSNNSTTDINRQILYGLNASDLSYFPGAKISFENGPLVINGDTGLSAGIKEELNAIKGQPRAIPLFSQVQSPGNNAMYTITRFVGIRILEVQLDGKNKYVVVQPAPVASRHAIPGGETISTGSIVTAPILID